MKNRESITVKLIKRFYGVSGVLDEYKRAQIDRMGNNAFMLLFIYVLLSSFIAIFFINKTPAATLWLLVGGNLFFTVFLIGGYILRITSRLELTDMEVDPQDFSVAKRKAIVKGIFAGVYFALTYHVLNATLSFMLNEGSFLSNLVTGSGIIASLIGGMLFGGCMVLYFNSRIKKV